MPRSGTESPDHAKPTKVIAVSEGKQQSAVNGGTSAWEAPELPRQRGSRRSHSIAPPTCQAGMRLSKQLPRIVAGCAQRYANRSSFCRLRAHQQEVRQVSTAITSRQRAARPAQQQQPRLFTSTSARTARRRLSFLSILLLHTS
jgi:hypothetical protein